MYFQAEYDCISPEADVLNEVYRGEYSVTLKSFISVSVKKGRKVNQVSTPQTLTCYWCVCGVQSSLANIDSRPCVYRPAKPRFVHLGQEMGVVSSGQKY